MLRQLHALVVDDEPHCRDLLCRQIGRTCPSITVIQTVSSAKEADPLIQELAPDVVFMDIHMPHKTGLDLLESLESRDFYLVFTTAFDRYAVEALRKRAFDYLLKPINRDDLQACARRILMHFYHHRNIVHVQAEGSCTTLHLASGRRITMSKNLKRVEEMLDNDMFFRPHNSHLVQLERVEACNYRDYTVVLDTGAVVPMAVRKREALKQRLSLLMSA